MRITIHRGANQIGGCVTEISTAASRIFVDMGDNLPGAAEQLDDERKQAFVKNLFHANKRTHEAVFYTHGHADHVGMLEYVPETVDQYMSQGTKDLLLLKEEVIRKGAELSGADGTINDYRIRRINDCETWQRPPRRHAPERLRVGDIAVTPFFVSHSIFDAHMLLIEADGKRVLHTGDYRGHGFLGKGLFPTLRTYVGQVDVLITEGTMLSRKDKVSPESEVSRRMKAMMDGFKYVVVLASSTDIERLAAIQGAAQKAGRMFVTCSMLMDKTLNYFASLNDGLPNNAFRFDHYMLSPSKPAKETIRRMRAKGFAMLVGAGHGERIKDILRRFDPEETLLIYSAWDGYYKLPAQIEANPGYSQIRGLFGNVVNIHTSGHADAPTIERVIQAVNPREAIIGIHKEADASLLSLRLPEELKRKIVPDRSLPDYISVR